MSGIINDSRLLPDYTSQNLHDHIKMMNDNEEIIQILPASGFHLNQITGMIQRDYLLIFKRVET